MAEPTAAIPEGSLILITGVTGHVASELTKQFLERGYKVRGTVRDLVKAAWLVEDVFKTHADSGNFEIVPVPDISARGAFDDAIKGASAVAHIATIGSFDSDPNKVVTPTVASVTSILDSASKEASVKRFVFTGSIVATTMLVPGNSAHITKDSWNDAVLDIAWAPPPYDQSRAFPVYMASKVAAEKELLRFVAEEKPHFAVNVVTPQTILGRRLNKNCTSLSAKILPSLYEGNLDIVQMLPACKSDYILGCCPVVLIMSRQSMELMSRTSLFYISQPYSTQMSTTNVFKPGVGTAHITRRSRFFANCTRSTSSSKILRTWNRIVSLRTLLCRYRC